MTNDNAFIGAVELGKKIARGALTATAATQAMMNVFMELAPSPRRPIACNYNRFRHGARSVKIFKCLNVAAQ